MKRFVDGVEVELADEAVIDRLPDRLIVHTPEGSFTALAVRQGDSVLVSFRGGQYRVDRKLARKGHHAVGSSGEMRAPMPGQIVDVRVSLGQSVKKGEVLLVLEAMKTQQPFTAPFDGVVKVLNAERGEQVSDGQVLVEIEEA